MAPHRRADILLVERGLFESRAKAKAAIAAGLVSADAMPVRKPSEPVALDARLVAVPAFAWVSRGGVKLAAALDHFGTPVAGRFCLDVGASTWGFTEVLLARGARLVYAVDVGTDQLHRRLRGRADVMSFEQADIRGLDRALLPKLPDLVVVDVSFISLKLVLPAALALAARPLDLLALIKPQFEAPRRAIKKGIVRDPAVHDAVCADIAAFASSRGGGEIAIVPSAIAGADGNREFFLGARFG
jgi:23S rRNA (cytidine1920-2'-O)/16S rRNA (cytidine1409-2'-O)-methyltransferase